MKKIFISIIFIMAACATACADIVYTNEGGGVGLVEITASPKSATHKGIQYTSNIPGAVIASFWENNTSNGDGNSKLILISPDLSTDTTVSGDRAYIFNPSTLTQPANEVSKPFRLVGSYGTPKVVQTETGNTLYVATDTGLREYYTAGLGLRNTYAPTSKDFNIKEDPVVVDVVNVGYASIVLVGRNETSGDVVVTLDGKLDSKGEVKVRHDNYAIASLSSGLAVGNATGVITVSGSTSKDLFTTAAPVVSICRDSGSGFYYVVSGDGLYHYKDENNKDVSLTKNSGANDKVMNAGNNILVAIAGTKLAFYNMEDDSSITSFDVAPTSIATRTTSGQSGGSGGSGCSIGGVGVIMMAVVFMSLARRRKS